MRDDRLWIDADNLALLTDQYELTMMQAYWAKGMHADATFSLYFRELPPTRRFMLACGQVFAAQLAAGVRFTTAALDQLAGLGTFRDDFLRWLEDFRFTGDIVTLAEGTPVFPYEPLAEVTAPVAQAQFIEPLLMNLVHLETVLASKAVRVVQAAQGRPVADFGMRRMHGLDAAVQGVRAYRIAGISGTSHVLAGVHYDVPVLGTMAHSFVECFDNEADAFLNFADLYPATTLLVDTYDTLRGVERLIGLKKAHGARFNVGAVRLDSGDLEALSRAVRGALNAAGMDNVRIVASGGLDEYKINKLVKAGAPIDAFGVGTSMGTSADASYIDLSYKLTRYADKPRLKNAPGKPVYPGAKQVWRHRRPGGQYAFDELTQRNEVRDAQPLLQSTVREGEPDDAAERDLDRIRAYAQDEIAALPPSICAIEGHGDAYDVRVSDVLRSLRETTLAQHAPPRGN